MITSEIEFDSNLNRLDSLLNLPTIPTQEIGFDDITTGVFGATDNTTGIEAGVNVQSNLSYLQSRNFVSGSTGWRFDSNGDLEADSGTFRGTITATTGTIGGWTINATSIYTGTEDHSGYTANAGDITIYSDGNDASIHAKNFYIDTTGIIYCAGAVIDGTSTIAGITGTQISYVATSTADIVPTNLAYSTGGISTGSDGSQSAYVVITWTAISSSTFDHYLVRYKKAALAYYTYIPATTNTITIEGLTPNVSYNFGVASINKYGTSSAFSADISQTTASDTTAPATVTSDSATAGIQYVILEWTHNTETDLASYNIYRHTANDSGASSLIGNSRTNYFVDGGRTGGQIYYYWVKAVDTSGNESASFSTVQSATPRDVGDSDISSTAAIAATKVLIDGVVYLSNWRHASDITKIDGGDIYANSVTLTQLNFTPVQTNNVIASINASAEGITIDADNLYISSSTTFASGYNPTGRVLAVGGTYDSAASGARVRIFPDANTGLQIIDDATADVFKCIVGGADVGDVIIGNYTGNQGIKYDKSANTTTFAGTISAASIDTRVATGSQAIAAAGGTYTQTPGFQVRTVFCFNSNAAAGPNIGIYASGNNYATGTIFSATKCWIQTGAGAGGIINNVTTTQFDMVGDNTGTAHTVYYIAMG